MRKKLSTLSGKRRQQDATIEDALFDSMASTMRGLIMAHRASGEPLSVLPVCDGVTVEIDYPEGAISWSYRLTKLEEAAAFVSSQDSVDMTPRSVAAALARADGWIANAFTLKTPAWLEPHAEVPMASVLSRFPWVADV